VNDAQSGDHTGSGFIRFDSTESATAAMQALDGTQTANGEKITLIYANPAKPAKTDSSGKGIPKPNKRLFFSGCTGSVSEIKTLFQEFSASVKDIHLCMLFTLSDSVPITHNGVTLNSE
jgi:RNA recognition motif-containing protein